MSTNNPTTSDLTNMIKKIINHRHIKSLAALAIVIGLIGYASEYKKSEAFEYSTYMYNVSIQSSNAGSKSIGVAGDQVRLSFEVYDAGVLSNLTASIDGKPITVSCELINTEVLTFNFIEKAYAQFYNPAMCIGSIVLTQEDIDASPYIFTTLPFEIKFTQAILDSEITYVKFVATNTDDGSSVGVKRNSKSSDYVSNVHIESTNPADITLASADKQVIVSYYVNEYSYVSNHKAYILEKEAIINCQPAKEGIPASTDVLTPAQSSVKSTTSPIVIIVPVEPSVRMDISSVPATADITKGTGATSFVGPAYCTATIDTTAEDLVASDYSIVPFNVYMIITTRVDKAEFKIENVTDKSFVRISKAVTAVEPVVTGGILAVGLISSTPSTVIPQGQDVNLLNKDNRQDIVDNLDVNEKCIPIKGFYKLGDKNIEIKEIRKSINKRMGTDLPITDKFDKELFNTLKDWQEKYRDTVLDPWEMESPSGYFYKTSNWSMNFQSGCPVPKFVLEKYKNK